MGSVVAEQNNAEYYVRRAREERDKAANCAEASVALIHRQMAEQYERRAAELAGSASGETGK